MIGIPKPTKATRPGIIRREEIRQRDIEFQKSIPPDAVCVVGGPQGKHCWGRLARHHVKRRRFIRTRWEPKYSLVICEKHHDEGHTIGPKAFKEKYGIDFA